MAPKRQAPFPGHPIKCPSCYETIYVSCTRCKGLGKPQVYHAGYTLRTTGSTAGGMQPKDPMRASMRAGRETVLARYAENHPSSSLN